MVELRSLLTTTYRAPGSPPSRSSPCRLALGQGSSSAFRGAIAHLLHYRLRVFCLIGLLPMGFFFVRNLIAPSAVGVGDPVGLFLHAGALVVLVLLLILLTCGRAMSLGVLRAVEMIGLGSVVAFFAWWQYAGFASGAPFGVTCPMVENQLVQAAAMSSMVRWFFLIVIYGVLIPNTWGRCALIAGGTAILPLIVTPVAAGMHGHLTSDLWRTIPDMGVLMLTAVAVAVFGSYRLQALEEEAFEAKQLGQYRLKQRLGSGGMGEVYLAEHVLLRRPCAVKLIRPEQAGDCTALQRFEREVQAMATLTHWNSVEVYDYGHADDGTFYYVMEFLPGANLDHMVSEYGPLPPARAIHFLRQVCAALREAHSVGLLHRDVKPSNVFACERGGVYDVAKLLDFGLVQDSGFNDKTADRLTMQGTILGSPPFMSPEQAAGKPILDGRSDIYSLGAVAYFLVTGQPPFVRETAMQMLMAHAYDPVTPPSQVQPAVGTDLEAVILRCLEKDPARRYPDAHAVERALAECDAADTWTEDMASAWWQRHGQPVAGLGETSTVVPTVVRTV
jgi:serine/threonine-protein kinase